MTTRSLNRTAPRAAAPAPRPPHWQSGDRRRDGRRRQADQCPGEPTPCRGTTAPAPARPRCRERLRHAATARRCAPRPTATPARRTRPGPERPQRRGPGVRWSRTPRPCTPTRRTRRRTSRHPRSRLPRDDGTYGGIGRQLARLRTPRWLRVQGDPHLLARGQPPQPSAAGGPTPSRRRRAGVRSRPICAGTGTTADSGW